ncbi:hypothetical protein B0H11DRAFT_1953978 [Mycena galericulata]|nr:hypothetical protein B0H11DRAFT_1953978 [Mycena galericulata]
MCCSRCIGFAGVAAFDPCGIDDSESSVVFLPSTISSIKRVATTFHRIAFILRSPTSAFRSFAVEWSQENESLYGVHLPLVRRCLIRPAALRCSALPRPSPRSLSSFSPYYPRYLDFNFSPAYFSAPTRHMRNCDGADSISHPGYLCIHLSGDVTSAQIILLFILGYHDSAVHFVIAPGIASSVFAAEPDSFPLSNLSILCFRPLQLRRKRTIRNFFHPT